MFIKKYLTISILLVAPMLLQHHQSDAIKCYVCGDDTNNFLYSTNDKQDSPPVPCTTLNEHLNNSKAMQKYITECPKEYYGCITQIQGDQVTRACDIFPLDDCQIANSITYCYCSSDLCNGETDTFLVSLKADEVDYKLTSSTKETMINNKDFLDDEDYNTEMSGHGNNNDEDENMQDEIITSTDKNRVNLIKTTQLQSTTNINVPEIITDATIITTNKNSENEDNLDNEILIDEDEIMTTTDLNKTNSTTIKNHIKIYNKSNKSKLFDNCLNINRLLLIVVIIALYQ